jgi:hypothetical protein
VLEIIRTYYSEVEHGTLKTKPRVQGIHVCVGRGGGYLYVLRSVPLNAEPAKTACRHSSHVLVRRLRVAWDLCITTVEWRYAFELYPSEFPELGSRKISFPVC